MPLDLDALVAELSKPAYSEIWPGDLDACLAELNRVREEPEYRISKGAVTLDRWMKDWALEIQDALLDPESPTYRKWFVRITIILPNMAELDYRSVTTQMMIQELQDDGFLKDRVLPLGPGGSDVLITVEQQLALATTMPSSVAIRDFGRDITLNDLWEARAQAFPPPPEE